jgi:hypothetical protein
MNRPDKSHERALVRPAGQNRAVEMELHIFLMTDQLIRRRRLPVWIGNRVANVRDHETIRRAGSSRRLS